VRNKGFVSRLAKFTEAENRPTAEVHPGAAAQTNQEPTGSGFEASVNFCCDFVCWRNQFRVNRARG
jgi:hypothetical protein